MFTSLQQFFSTDSFMPHGHCYLWKPSLVLLQVISNAVIGVSYVAISSTLAYLVYRIRNIPFQWIYLAFGLFIVSCGFTHFMDIWTVWEPVYWADGMIRALTAVSSVGTAVILPILVPKAVAFAQAAKSAHDRGIRVETAYEQLGKVFEKTKELDELKTQFFANVSHELRTPLTLVLGPLERLKSSQNLTEIQQKDLELMARNARILLKHVNDLLDVAKLEAHKMKPSYANADLSNLTRVLTGNFDGLAQERQIHFNVSTPETLPVQIDPEMIQRVLTNLLSNAFKFVPIGGHIHVSVDKKNSHVAVTVQDNGPGVPLEHRAAIFERFRQVDGGSTRTHGGTGLGLSIAKEFIELHRGTIGVSETPGGGATFRFEIPLAAPAGVPIYSSPSERFSPEAAIHELQESSRRLDSLTATNGDRPLVLVVEDNPDMNRFVSEILSKEYRIESAHDGREGLEKISVCNPDLVLTDIMMPRMSGNQMIDEIRKDSKYANTPIVLLTAKADDDLRNKLLRESAQDFVVKPFSSEELFARVKNLISVKRAKDALQNELSSQLQDIEILARELSQRKRDLQTMVDELRAARDEAEKASRAKSAFLGMVSHEIKTPITSLKLQLEVLKRIEGERLTPAQLDLVNRLERSSRRAVHLMDTLLEYTKIQSGKIQPKSEYLNLTSVVQDTAEALAPEAQAKDINLEFVAPEKELPLLETDKLLVQIIVRNLISNAVKYTDVGAVKVKVGFEGNRHVVQIKDTGPGIPEQYQSVIFEPFEQVTPLEKKNKPGFGLGLSIAKETARVIGGKIELESAEGRGSTFTVTIPPYKKSPQFA